MEELFEPMDVEMVPINDDDSKVEESGQPNVNAYNSNNVPMPEQIELESRYENHSGTFTTGIDIFSKEEKMKMKERAKRFGITNKSSLANSEDLYASMGIDDDSENTKKIRLNVIHMRGTEDMSTKDVFKYFEDYAPASIEWINDVSCNVVWLDSLSASRAMLGLSKKIVGLEKSSEKDKKIEPDNSNPQNNVNTEDGSIEIDGDNEIIDATKDMLQENNISIKDIDRPLPPGLWRKGVDYPKSKALFLRFATRADKKQPKAEKMSDYYKKYGNPNFGGIKGILTESRKRMYKQTKKIKRRSREDLSEDNKEGKRSKNPWGELSESWGINDFVEDGFTVKNEAFNNKEQGRSVKERLGIKCPSKESVHPEEQQEESNSSSDSEEEWCKRSKVLRMRMHADDEEEKIHKRRAKIQQQTVVCNFNRGDDLRSRLGKPRRMQFTNAIQVVVTNTNITKPSSMKLNDSEEEDGEIVDDDDEEVEEDISHENEEIKWQKCEMVEEQGEEEDRDESEEDSDIPAREVQGPKGSVIKVVQNKPRVASTVWARLNHVKSEVADNSVKHSQPRTRDMKNILKGSDLRSRIGNHTRGRSPLRIEVKNDKYTEGSGTE